MTDKIIALVDGSIYSASVCNHAAWIAQRTGAPVELLHVLGRREGAGKQDLSGTVGLGARSALLAELADLDAQRAKLMTSRGHAILEDAQAILAKAGLIEATSRLRHGDIVEAVAEVEAEARVIVLGKRGEAAADRDSELTPACQTKCKTATQTLTRPYQIDRQFAVAGARDVFA